MDTKEVIEQAEGLLLIPEREVNYSWPEEILLLPERDVNYSWPEERQIVKKHEEYLALRQSVHELLSALKQSQAKVEQVGITVLEQQLAQLQEANKALREEVKKLEREKVEREKEEQLWSALIAAKKGIG